MGSPHPPSQIGPGPSTMSSVAGSRKLWENKPNEPPFQMKIEPECFLVFKPAKDKKLTDSMITVELKITNTTKQRQTFKIKCTNNEVFRVRPPIGFIKPDETSLLKVSFDSRTMPENNRHFFAVYHFPSEDTTTAVRQLWIGKVKVEGVKRIVAQFENADGSPLADAPASKKVNL